MRKFFLSYFGVKFGCNSRIQQYDRFACVLEKKKPVVLNNIGRKRTRDRNMLLLFQLCTQTAKWIALEENKQIRRIIYQIEHSLTKSHNNFQGYQMQQLQKKKIIHHVLNKQGFYRLPLAKLHQVLRLLQVPQVRDAKSIQENSFRGLIRLTDSLLEPEGASKIRNKKYFRYAVTLDVSREIKKFLTNIVEQVLQIRSDPSQMSAVGALQDPSAYPMYPMAPMGQNPMNFTGGQERMNMQMQMYYMNMYNYGNQSQIAQNYPQSLPKAEEIEPAPVPDIIQKPMLKEVLPEVPEMPELPEISQRIQEEVPNITEKQVIQQVESQQNLHLEADQIHLPFQHMEEPPRPMNQIKMVAQEIQIQTDLSLLNEEIEVFPRNEKPLNIIEKVVQIKKLKEKKKKEAKDVKAVKDVKEIKEVKEVKEGKERIDQTIKDKMEGTMKDVHQGGVKQKIQGAVQTVMKDASFLDEGKNEKNQEKNITSYTITVNKEYFNVRQPNESLIDPPFLKSKNSQFDRFERQVKQNLKNLQLNMREENYLRDCRCKGGQSEAKCFQCLTCRRKFHFSCLNYPQMESVEECHICKLQTFDPVNQVKEVIGLYYISDILRQKFQVQLPIAQYEYFLFKKIRTHDLQMRCCQLNTFQGYKLGLPEQLVVCVNGKTANQVHGPVFQSNGRKEALVLTDYVIEDNYQKDDQTLQIKIGIDFRPFLKNFNQKAGSTMYCIGIYFIERVQMTPMIDKYSKNISTYKTDFIDSLLYASKDQQLEIQKEVCTLYDPFTHCLIDTPVRGANCTHSQCFDLRNFLAFMYATKNRQWRCPVCKKETKRFKLDELFVRIIKKSEQDRMIPSEITFTKDGKIALKISKDDQDDDDDTPPLIKGYKKKAKLIKKQEKPDNGDKPQQKPIPS